MSTDINNLFKTAIETVKPDLDKYRKGLRKGRIINSYCTAGSYVCDLEILLNDDTPDTTEPIVRAVELPVIWGGKDRGIIVPPSPGSYCDVEYYRGDPNFPRVSNIRYHNNFPPQATQDELIIQQRSGVLIAIRSNGDIHIKTDSSLHIDLEGNLNCEVNGDLRCEVEGELTATVKGEANLDVQGKVSVKGDEVTIDGGSSAISGAVTGLSICPITGSAHMDCSSTVFVTS